MQTGKSACVIGAGLAGGLIAAKLAEAGFRATLLEQGDVPRPSNPTDEDWEGLYRKSIFTRGEGIGGSSNFWHGGLIVLDRSDIEGPSRSGNGPKFPISYAHLCDYYRGALEIVAPGSVSLDDLLKNEGRGDAFPLEGNDFRLKPLILPSRPFSTKSLIENARQKHGVNLVTGFLVDRLLFSGPTRVSGVEGYRKGEKALSRITADVFVLTAGGIGSPKILLKSAKSNPALQRLPIGRNLIDHPTGFVFKATLRNRINLNSMFGSPHDKAGLFRMRFGRILRESGLKLASGRNHVLYLRPALSLRDPRDYFALKGKLEARKTRRLTMRDFLQLFSYGDLLAEALNFRFGLITSVRHVAGVVFAEQLAAEENCMSLQDNRRFRMKWDFAPEDAKSLQDFLNAFVRAHDNLFERVSFFSDSLVSGAHHSGGCRMAADESQGVVGSDMRVFGVSNLFVGDGSVLGYSGHANTGLTIAALALKCADEVCAGH